MLGRDNGAIRHLVAGKCTVTLGFALPGGLRGYRRGLRRSTIAWHDDSTAEVAFGDDPLQHLLGRGKVKAAVWVLAEQPLNHRQQRARMGWRLELVGHHGSQASEHAIPLERGSTFDRREQRSSQGPKIRGGARTSAACAFGREVGRRTEQHPRVGQGRAVGGLCDAEVGQHYPALRTE